MMMILQITWGFQCLLLKISLLTMYLCNSIVVMYKSMTQSKTIKQQQQNHNRTRMDRLQSKLTSTCTIHCVACCSILDIREQCSGTFWLKIKQFLKNNIPFSLGCSENGKGVTGLHYSDHNMLMYQVLVLSFLYRGQGNNQRLGLMNKICANKLFEKREWSSSDRQNYDAE